jgi:hypothetical protein
MTVGHCSGRLRGTTTGPGGSSCPVSTASTGPYWRASLSEKNRRSRCSTRMRADRNATRGAQLLWLGEAGFESIGCKYKDHRFAVYNGRKGHENSENGKDADG